MKLCASLVSVFCLAFTSGLHANNIQVSNTTLVNNTGTTAKVQFTVSWENSWRGGGVNNWDAVWIFVKYQIAGEEWQHARLSATGHTAPAGSLLEAGLLTPSAPFDPTTNPLIGLFIRRDADGTGTFNAPGIELLWEYGALGLTYNDISAVQVFAIEMVHVPEGPFYVGSNGAEADHFQSGQLGTAYQVTSEAEITLGGNGTVLNTSVGLTTGQLPAAFPKGYAAYYSMKYELSQQQYTDMLNTLGREQQAARVGSPIAPGSTGLTVPYVMSGTATMVDRQSIRCNGTFPANAPIHFYCDANGNGTGGEADDGQWLACGYLSWRDVAAYLDWSGLRPMTELEFEKACRGTLAPLANEFPWRTTSLASSPYTLISNSTVAEGIASGYGIAIGNANHVPTGGPGNGPLRVGVFAANGSNTGRATSGAGYCGAMELAGNLWEVTISVAVQAGRNFTGTHGNGALDLGGNPDVASWPSAQATGAGNRGGSFGTSSTELRTSDRTSAATATPVRVPTRGGRGVRSAP